MIEVRLLPDRIVCLSYDAVDMLVSIGASADIVGIPAGTTGPGLEHAVSIGGFAKPDLGLILSLHPDLVIGYDSINAPSAARLIRENVATLILQHSCIAEVYASVALLGAVTGRTDEAASVIKTMQNEFLGLTHEASRSLARPVVYFEEWDKPMTCGPRWISELIGMAGGVDAFRERAEKRKFIERKVTSEDVVNAAPDIILASWCGKPVDTASFGRRSGWESMPAVRNGLIYEVPGEIVLRPGPSLVHGASYLRDLFARQLN